MCIHGLMLSPPASPPPATLNPLTVATGARPALFTGSPPAPRSCPGQLHPHSSAFNCRSKGKQEEKNKKTAGVQGLLFLKD